MHAIAGQQKVQAAHATPHPLRHALHGTAQGDAIAVGDFRNSTPDVCQYPITALHCSAVHLPPFTDLVRPTLGNPGACYTSVWPKAAASSQELPPILTASTRRTVLLGRLHTQVAVAVGRLQRRCTPHAIYTSQKRSRRVPARNLVLPTLLTSSVLYSSGKQTELVRLRPILT